MKFKEKKIWERKEDSLLCLAYASLLNWKEPTDLNNILAEKTRIERVAESFYKAAKDQEYNAFILEWIKENGREIVYGDRFSYDVDLPDNMTETNVNLFCRKGKY